MTKHEQLRVAVAEAVGYRRVWNHCRTAALLMLPSETNSPPDEIAPADAELHPCVFEKIPALTLDAIQAAALATFKSQNQKNAYRAAIAFAAYERMMFIFELPAEAMAEAFLSALKTSESTSV